MPTLPTIAQPYFWGIVGSIILLVINPQNGFYRFRHRNLPGVTDHDDRFPGGGAVPCDRHHVGGQLVNVDLSVSLPRHGTQYTVCPTSLDQFYLVT